MRCSVLLVLAATSIVPAEIRTLTLKEAADLAARQSPEVLLARLDELRATAAAEAARDPFVPKFFVGSGLAYTSGFPMSLDGSAPSIIQARAVSSIYNKPQKLALAQAREQARGAGIATLGQRDSAVGRVVSAFLDTERRSKFVGSARRQVESAEKVNNLVALRVQEGRELPLEGKRAALELVKARQRLLVLEADRDAAEATVAFLLGLLPGDRVRPAGEERQSPELPASAEAAVEEALRENREIKRLESALVAKGFETQARRAERYPVLDLVAQYGLFARFNNYEDFFQRFQRHNGQLGVSIQLPVLFGPGPSGRIGVAESEAARIRLQINQVRGRVTLDTRKQFLELQKVDSARHVNRLELELARETLDLQLARFDEGRASLRQVEEARLSEQEKWMAYYDAVAQAEAARYALLESTGRLMAALR